jgi:hypothetical protein
MIHFQTTAVQADFIQKLFGVSDSFLGSEISFQEMAVTDFSAPDQDGIRPGLKGLEDMEDIDFSGTEQLDDPDIMGIL